MEEEPVNRNKWMMDPVISVILPAYNAGATIRESVVSILNQSFENFELIIIEDGSQDDTHRQLVNFNDSRVRIIYHKENLGLVMSLNEGVDAARGKFIARMDADDVSLPNRLAEQLSFMNKNDDVQMLSSTIILVDELGIERGTWNLDRQTITHRQIAATLPWENCIAHPTVFGRTGVFRRFRYEEREKHMEDYGLWLRMVAAGVRFEKIPIALLRYRVHGKSVTATQLKDKRFFFRHASLKRRFVLNQVKKGRMNSFILKTLLTNFADLGRGIIKSLR